MKSKLEECFENGMETENNHIDYRMEMIVCIIVVVVVVVVVTFLINLINCHRLIK